MKKSKKIMLRVLPVVFVLVIIVANVYASSPISPNLNVTGNGIASVDKTVGNVWATIRLILQVAAIGAIIFAGVRYMFASADTKADIKKQMVILVIGAVLVFGATTLIGFIQTVTNDVIGQ